MVCCIYLERWVKGESSNQKLPITLEILFRMFSKLTVSCSLDGTFWAAYLVVFFTLFRKSNLFIPTLELFDPSRHLCAADVQFGPQGVILTIRGSKVIQFRERVLHIPLPLIPDSVFCPSNALLWMSLECPIASTPVPLFRYKEGGETQPTGSVVNISSKIMLRKRDRLNLYGTAKF